MSSDACLVVFRGVRALDPARGLDAIVDVVVEDGAITRLGPSAGDEPARAERARIIEGKGRWLLPAFVDLHAHFREPGHEYKEDITSGLRAAARGGYAHVCAMPNTRPVNDNRAVTEMMLSRAAAQRGPRLHPIGAITVGQAGQKLTEMGELREAGVVAVSDDGVCLQSSAVMRRALEYAKNFDLPVIQHAEDAELVGDGVMHEGAVASRLGLRGRPRVAEDVIVARDIILAEYVDATYHVAHVSTQGAVSLVAAAKDRGAKVTAEVTPHHLLLTDADCLGYQTYCKVNPPLREAEDVQTLIRALDEGIIDAIATDHAPHAAMEKDCEFSEAASGIVGLEFAFPLLLGLVHSGQLRLSRLLDALSTRPARLIGITPPSLAVGACAELVLVDPEVETELSVAELAGKSKNTPFLGRTVRGRVLLTLAGGHIVFEHRGVTE